MFEMTWLKAHKAYVDGYHEAKARPVKEPISIDGVLDEAPWREAEPITKFFV